MHQLSDGQRRRVQIFLGLIRPFEILCLDEITTSLDVVVRQDLLRWLTKESEERGATILYATHIFDGLDDWATHLLYLTDKGRCGWQGPVNELPLYRQLSSDGKHPAKMLAVAEAWLRAEWDERKQKRRREKAMGAGALLEEMNVTDRSQGGYSSGRMRMDVVKQPEPCRPGRLSDVFGNRGVMDKVSRIANDDGV
jgi:CCR4-NOT complex subunit CAF16